MTWNVTVYLRSGNRVDFQTEDGTPPTSAERGRVLVPILGGAVDLRMAYVEAIRYEKAEEE